LNNDEDPLFEWVDFTPETAEKALADFGPNRTPSASTVQKYARMMQAGQWLQAGDPVRVTADGTYIDGEHRLRAIILAGITVRLPVMYGVPAEAMKVVDTGRGRQYKHILQIGGAYGASELAPIVRRMFLWDAGIHFTGAGKKITPSPIELDDYLAAHPELIEVARKVKAGRPPSVGGAAFGTCMAIFSRLSADSADSFCDAWVTGINLPTGHPVLALRDRIARDTGSYGKSTGSDFKIALACCAWNAFREARTLSKIQLPAGFPVTYPVPR
jgi:hypothetical protein